MVPARRLHGGYTSSPFDPHRLAAPTRIWAFHSPFILASGTRSNGRPAGVLFKRSCRGLAGRTGIVLSPHGLGPCMEGGDAQASKPRRVAQICQSTASLRHPPSSSLMQLQPPPRRTLNIGRAEGEKAGKKCPRVRSGNGPSTGFHGRSWRRSTRLPPRCSGPRWRRMIGSPRKYWGRRG